MRLGLLPDFEEENWPSMSITAGKLREEIEAGHVAGVQVENLRPPYKRRFTRLPAFGRSGLAVNADRFLNRMKDYPRHARQFSARVDCFHVCDHSYANLVHALPSERCGVFCHDLDAFQCLLDPAAPPRPRWFKQMVGSVLDGLKKAALVFYTTREIRRQILAHGLAHESRLVQAPLGVSPVYTPHSVPGFQFSNPALRDAAKTPFVLHVGSCAARKRIDLLLEIMSGLRKKNPALRLIKIGGPFTAPQRELLERLGLADACEQHLWLDEPNLAQLYRSAAVVLQPSESEGFGMPVIEALACGSRLVASDIPTLREAGGDGALYCPVGAVEQWVETVDRVLREPDFGPTKEARLRHAAKFSWTVHAQIICGAYRELLNSNAGPGQIIPPASPI